MSRDFEYFFESLGIRTLQISGRRYNSTEEPKSLESAHRWLLLDFGYFAIPFESTLSLPFYNPGGYVELRISEGFINRGNIYESLEWKPWI